MAHHTTLTVDEYNSSLPSTMKVPDISAARSQTYYYRPKVTKEECELLLRRKPIGTFIARDSSTFVGGFCIMMRLLENSMTVTRSYLLEKVPNGIHLRLTEEEVYPTLYKFLYAHSVDQLVLPSRLKLPTDDWLSTLDPALATKTHLSSRRPLDEPPGRPPKAEGNKPPPLPSGGSVPARPPKVEPPQPHYGNTGAPPRSKSRRGAKDGSSLPARPPKHDMVQGDSQPAVPAKVAEVQPPPRPRKQEADKPPSLPKSRPTEHVAPPPIEPPKPESPHPQKRTVVADASVEVDEVECEVYYYGCMDTWADSHVECIFQTYLELVEIRDVVPSKVAFKMAGQSITIEDKASKQFIRRHYPIRSILHFDLDPDQRTCKVKKEKKPLSVFGMVIRKPGQDKNLCHLFAAQHVATSGVIDAVQSALQLIFSGSN